MDDDNDPFRLVPVEQYHDNFPPPFEVEISANALVCYNAQLIMYDMPFAKYSTRLCWNFTPISHTLRSLD